VKWAAAMPRATCTGALSPPNSPQGFLVTVWSLPRPRDLIPHPAAGRPLYQYRALASRTLTVGPTAPLGAVVPRQRGRAGSMASVGSSAAASGGGFPFGAVSFIPQAEQRRP
jgi:hypothetical protein